MLRMLLADIVNHLSPAFHLQAVVQFLKYELPLLHIAAHQVMR
jgi:hypothetical protein